MSSKLLVVGKKIGGKIVLGVACCMGLYLRIWKKWSLVSCQIHGLDEKGRRIRELTSIVQKRFKFPENSVELYAEKVNNRGLCAIAQAESLCYKRLGGLAVRRACYGVLRFVMENGAKGCEFPFDITLSGYSGMLRAQRAKSMKFKDGYVISSGQPVNECIDSAVRLFLASR